MNVYCDESCHLEHDGINSMVIGAIWCPIEKVREINERIVQIKQRHGVRSNSEIKWAKIGPAKFELYQAIVDYFFDDDDLHFRCIVIPDKGILDHAAFSQTHDDWYYKMYFDMLKVIFSPTDVYNIYIDIKDDNSYNKSQLLLSICRSEIKDFQFRIIKKIQPIRSNEVQLMQIVDILSGALCYKYRVFDETFIKSKTKIKIIDQIIERSGYNLMNTTLEREGKMNLLIWKSRGM